LNAATSGANTSSPMAIPRSPRPRTGGVVQIDPRDVLACRLHAREVRADRRIGEVASYRPLAIGRIH